MGKGVTNNLKVSNNIVCLESNARGLFNSEGRSLCRGKRRLNNLLGSLTEIFSP